MASLLSILFVYILGGLTFLPLLVACLLLHAYLTFPHQNDDPTSSSELKHDLLRRDDDTEAVKVASAELDEKFKVKGAQENDVSSGYFAVSREYVPGGVGAKPPERTTPAGSTTIGAPSPSVYQSMYRSLFDRKTAASPIENKGAARPPKKGGNVFFVVLRHSHLMLFDDDEQLEVRYVISLAHHDVSIYGGGEEIAEGEVYIKRNALCLSRKSDVGDLTPDGVPSKPFFLFSDNTSDKEDFYFAMLKNQERKPQSSMNPPIPLQFEVKHIINLVQRLHSSEEHLQTRWLNALMGRIFLGLYKTTDIEDFVRAKITKKIARVKTPSFLPKISLRSIDLGESAPFITNPRLKDLTVDGDCVVELDMKYTGNVRVEIAATARIDLGSRFKAREVNLVLAVVLKKIEGHMQFRIKPPPSNRIWYTFTSFPKIEMSVEPIVSSRQITYTLILRQIENRIKEVIAESIVMPFWDDTAFFSTEAKKWRGGVWVDETKASPSKGAEDIAAEEGNVEEVEQLESPDLIAPDVVGVERSMTMPPETTTPIGGLFNRKSAVSLRGTSSNASGASTSIETNKSTTADTPKSKRISSFSPAPTAPVALTNNTNADAFKTSSPPDYSHAQAAMAAVAARSQPTTPVGSPSQNASTMERHLKLGSFSSIDGEYEELERSQSISPALTRENSGDSVPRSVPTTSASSVHTRNDNTSHPKSLQTHSTAQSSTSTSGGDSGVANKKTSLSAMASAAQSAKKWGLDALAARKAAQQAAKDAAAEKAARELLQPMGRGQPLPPPGTPLPPPKKTKTAPIPVPKRKPLQPPNLSPRIDEAMQGPAGHSRTSLAPSLPKRQSQASMRQDPFVNDGIFVVEAPASGPATPMEKEEPKYKEYESNYRKPTVSDMGDADVPTSMPSTLSSVPSPVQKKANPPQLPARPDKQSSEEPNMPPLPRRTGRNSVSGWPDEGDHMPSWLAAQEAENRAKNLWVDDDVGQLHQ